MFKTGSFQGEGGRKEALGAFFLFLLATNLPLKTRPQQLLRGAGRTHSWKDVCFTEGVGSSLVCPR